MPAGKISKLEQKSYKFAVCCSIILGLISVFIGFRGIFLAIHDVPTLDTFWLIDKISRNDFSILLGWERYESHRPVIPAMLVQTSLLATQVSSLGAYIPQAINLFSLVGLFYFLLFKYFQQTNFDYNLSISFFLFFLFILTNQSQHVSLLSHFRTWVGLSLVAVVLSSIALFKSNCASRIITQIVFYFVALFSAVLASIIGASGLLVWGVLPLVAIALRTSALRLIGILLVGLATFLTVRTQSSIAREGEGAFSWLSYPFEYFMETSFYLGSVMGSGLFIDPFARFSVAFSIGIGAILQILSVFLILKWIVSRRAKDITSVISFTVIIFGLGWGAVYILKHATVSQPSANWISGEVYGLVGLSTVACIIFQLMRKVRYSRYRVFPIILCLAIYIVLMPVNVFGWQTLIKQTDGWRLGLSKSITELATSNSKSSFTHPYSKAIKINRGTIKTLSDYRFPPFSDGRVQEILSKKSRFKALNIEKKCMDGVVTGINHPNFGRLVRLSGFDEPNSSLPMGFELSGKPIAYGVPVTNQVLGNSDKIDFRSERNWVVPLPKSGSDQRIRIFFVTELFQLKCFIRIPKKFV